MKMSLCTAAGLVLTLGAVATADVIHVPGDAASIGLGIKMAQPGDTVLVADGVYSGAGNYNIDPAGKAVTVKSAGGAGACTIDCQGAGRAFIFKSGESSKTVIEGFTITGGYIDQALGGAVECSNGSPTFRDCVFTGNTAGIYNGGAMHLGQGSTSLIQRCTFIKNTGGGGGAVFAEYSTPTIDSCVFEGNTAGVGGAMLCTGASPTVVNCLFTGNDAPDGFWGGGAIFCNAASTPLIVGCTITGNTAAGTGGALYSNKGSAPVLRGCIAWDNGDTEIFVSPNSGVPDVQYCDVAGGYAGTGNIDSDPKFVGAGDYSLGAGSPCIDAGDNTAVPPGTTTDLAGAARFVDDPGTPDTGNGTAPIVDMGAYEFQAAGCYADCDGSGELDIDDFICFQTLFGLGDLGADCDGSGELDIDDFICFQTAFGVGCP